MNRLLSKLGLMRVSERPDVPMRARAAETLEQHIMDVNIPKSDAEWWAMRHIGELRTKLAAERAAPVVDWEAKYKAAINDLAEARDSIKELRGHLAYAEADADSLRPDAEAMRRKRQMDRDRRANNRKGKDNG